MYPHILVCISLGGQYDTNHTTQDTDSLLLILQAGYTLHCGIAKYVSRKFPTKELLAPHSKSPPLPKVGARGQVSEQKGLNASALWIVLPALT